MKIILLFTIIVITLFFICKKVFYFAKKNLFKDQAAWSGKDIRIKYSNPSKGSESKGDQNYLKIIANESKSFLEEQSSQVKE